MGLCLVTHSRSGFCLGILQSKIWCRFQMWRDLNLDSIDVKITGGLDLKNWSNFGMTFDPCNDFRNMDFYET